MNENTPRDATDAPPQKLLFGIERFVAYGCDDIPLLIRYTLLKTKWGKLRFHIFLRSDHDREFHDHPWAFRTLILWGGYFEQTESGKKRYWPGACLYRPAEFKHRVELPPGNKCSLTLVWTYPDSREWGFWTEHGWEHYSKFLKKRICGE